MTLVTKVIGKPEPTVKWFKDDKEIKQTFKNKMTKEGEVCTYLHSSVTKKETGVYKCVATNKVGEAVHKATITVTEKMDPPVFTQKPYNKDVNEETKARFDAKAKGKPLPEITWYKGEEPLKPTNGMKIDTREVKGEMVTYLSFDKAKEVDIGDYSCVAKNPAGEAKVTTKLNVKGTTQSYTIDVTTPIHVHPFLNHCYYSLLFIFSSFPEYKYHVYTILKWITMNKTGMICVSL